MGFALQSVISGTNHKKGIVPLFSKFFIPIAYNGTEMETREQK